MDENNGAHHPEDQGGAAAWEEFWNVNVNNNTPRPTDVIMGRGHGAAAHPGNRRFRITCDLHRPRYDATDDKKEKSRIINEILHLVRQTARFRKQDALTGDWVEADDNSVRRKIGQVRRRNKTIEIAVLVRSVWMRKVEPILMDHL
jgi:hypothetical protein